MRLYDYLRALNIEPQGRDFELAAITDDSRKVVADTLFVAISGVYQDGREFLEEARAKGARCALVEQIKEDCDLPQILVADSRKAWSRLCDFHFGRPSLDMTMYGITATNGKTTISFMLDEILRAAGKKTGLIGTVKIRRGQETIPADMTTPDSFRLYEHLAKMKAAGLDSVIMEVSSSSLEQSRQADVDFDIVSFNNFSREHIDQHGSLEAYFQAKASLIQGVKPSAWAILNHDVAAITKLSSPAKEFRYSAKGEADLFIQGQQEEDLAFTVVIPEDVRGPSHTIQATRQRVELSIPGEHHVINALACIAMALAAGIGWQAILTGLKSFRGVERRFELIHDGAFKILDDHFANVDNIRVTLKSLTAMDYKKLHMVYAIRGNRGVTVNRENITTLAEYLPDLKMDEIIATKTLGEVTAKDLVLPEEEAVFHEEMAKTRLPVVEKDRLDDAIDYALDRVEPGDIILLAGCQGMDLGGGKILKRLAQENPEEASVILAPIQGRVCDPDFFRDSSD